MKTKKVKPVAARRGKRAPKARRVDRAWQEDTRASNGLITRTPAAAPVVKPRPVARMRRATATAAARRGAELTRYLRIHTKHPYADRGIRAIHKLALEVAHLGRLELGASAPVAEN